MDNGSADISAIVPFNNGFAVVSYAINTYSYTLSAPDAFAIDSKLDDGLPRSGKIQNTYSYAGITYHSDISGCLNSARTEYDLRGNWNIYTNGGDTGNTSRIECGLAILKAF